MGCCSLLIPSVWCEEEHHCASHQLPSSHEEKGRLTGFCRMWKIGQHISAEDLLLLSECFDFTPVPYFISSFSIFMPTSILPPFGEGEQQEQLVAGTVSCEVTSGHKKPVSCSSWVLWCSCVLLVHCKANEAYITPRLSKASSS